MSRSPYLVGPPVGNTTGFYGRQQQVDRFFEMLGGKTLTPLWVWGLRRSGKTSFLLYVADRHVIAEKLADADNVIVAYVDLLAGIQSPEDFYMAVAESIAASASDRLSLDVPAAFPTFRSFRNWVSAVLASDEKCRVVVLLDEFDVLSEMPTFTSAFFNSLRALAGPTLNLRLTWVTASSRELFTIARDLGSQDTSSPFFNIFHSTPIVLGSLESEEAARLICEPAQHQGVEFTDSEVNAIQTVAGRLPYFLQIAAEQWFLMKIAGETTEACLEKLLAKCLGPFCTIPQVLERYWQHLTVQERACLQEAAKMNLKAEDSRSTLSVKLMHLGFLVEWDGRLLVSGEIIRQWINNKPVQADREYPRIKYQDFQIRVTADRKIHVSSTQGEEHDEFKLRTKKIAATRVLIENRQADAECIKKFGNELYQALFPRRIHGLMRAAQAGAEAVKNRGMRLRLVFESPEISALPWEFLYDETTNTFLGNDSRTALSRYIDVPLKKRDLGVVQMPLKVLVVISHPTDLPPLDIVGEEKLIREALSGHVQAGRVELDVLDDATIRNIQHALREKSYNIFHFIGHGNFVNDRALIALVDSNGKARPLAAEDFANIFLESHSPGLIVLNACKGAEMSSTQAFVGIAPNLVRRNIPAVVAMQYSILDTTAKLFADEFYRALALGLPVDAAIQITRNAISIEVGQDKPDFATPVLYMRAKDGVILRPHQLEKTGSPRKR